MEILSGERVVEQHIQGPNIGKLSPSAGWSASKSNRKAMGNLDFANEEHAHACLLLKQGRLKTAFMADQFPATDPAGTQA